MGWLIFDGISVLIVFTLSILLLILMGIFAHRQITRLRNNSARNKINISLPFSMKSKKAIADQLDNVRKVVKSYQPRLTDCTTIAQHSEKPYVNRMIAVDEIALEIDSQLLRIDKQYARLPGEDTFKYLNRISKQEKRCELPAFLCQRLAFLHHAARFSPQKFDVEHLMELRSLLNQFVKLLAEKINSEVPSSGNANISLKTTSQLPSRREARTKFGGSDGGRLLANQPIEERVALLPSGNSKEIPSHRRRRSDSNQPLLS